MRQRLGIAAALLRRPKLMLLDEPATGLDPAGMRDMRLLVRRLADDGMTVLLSSHLLAEVEELCNRVAIVRRGRMAYEGTLADLRRAAGTVYHLRTTDDDRALAVCAAQPGIEDAGPAEHGGHRLPRHIRGPGRRAVPGAGRGPRTRARAGAQPRDARRPLLRAHRRRRRDRPGRRAGRDREGGMRPGVFAVYRWELQKLRFQKRTYLGLGAAALVPIIFAVAVATQNGQPEDVAFGRYIHETGLAIPLVLLLFGSIWMFPLITALVAGDIVAAEDHNGTLKTILTRSVERGQVFVGKALATATYAIAAIALTGIVAVVAGSLASGLHPLPTLSGTTISTGRALVLIGAQPARLPHPDPVHRGHRAAVLDHLPQQRRGRRRHPDGLAAAAADRHPARGSRRCSPTC